MAKSNFTIWVNENVYWNLDLIPVQNECDEFINRCSLIDSKTQKEIEAINFDSNWLIPIFSSRSQIGMKELAIKLKEITDKRGIKITPRTNMPEDKRIKKTEKIEKRIVK
jgi:hypothetical protein